MGKWIAWWSLFANLNYMNIRDNYMQMYNKYNENKLYIIKRIRKRNWEH